VYVGIDVGGTFTDAVLLDNDHVLATAKVPTRDGEELLISILEALDSVLSGVDTKLLKRVVFSTTIITNFITSYKYNDVALLLIPGPGLIYNYFDFGARTCILSGAVDYRGREIINLKEEEIKTVLSELAAEGFKKVGVVGKFSPRNTMHEKKVAAMIKDRYPQWHVELGSRIGVQLNFPRRVHTTYLTCATREPYCRFINSVRQALVKRKIYADIYILKADGGTMPLDISEELPVETIFSGPAASTLGVQALIPPKETAVVVDVGGTTTDLALILSGRPLLAAKGARVANRLTQVRALAVKSVPVGGDSVLKCSGINIKILPERLGPAYCMGGPVPTPTDALRVLGFTSLGDGERAREAMDLLGKALGMVPEEVARKVIDLVVDKITAEVQNMFLEWEQEPAYRVWEILHKHKVRPAMVVGVGGGAAGFISMIAMRLGCRSLIPRYAAVANAIGAAVAKPTLQVSLRVDTEKGYYIVQEEGYQGSLKSKKFNEQNALDLAREWLVERAGKYGVKIVPAEIEIIHQETFNMIRGWVTTGRLFDITMQTPRGIIENIGPREVVK
jgi:N-methylhydantoinase A/oxoprolinase/acetone carboxylase beta subunit